MNARELHDEECFREWLAYWRDHAANAPVVNGYWKRIERALSLLASVEESQDDLLSQLRVAAITATVFSGLMTERIEYRAAALIVSLREEVARKDAENEHVAEMFVAVVEQLDDDRNQAPGHAHNIPGIWDRDNGPLAGKPCAWCALWREARNVTNAYRAARPKE